MSLDSLLTAANDNSLKFVFVGGKGGVGKTTSSSAIASLFATHCNKKVLLVSTDPAHSLGDAWRTRFGNEPTSPMANVDVMEIDPRETMDMELAKWMDYAKALEGLEEEEGNGGDGGESEMIKKVTSFQEWLSGIPGIDEATALSSAISHIESGSYDLIVFDTAPTGHTLKLLALPEVLTAGINKLQTWSTTLWGYWEAFKGLRGGRDQAKKKLNLKDEIAQKLQDYKQSIEKVADMLQDPTATRFIVVCIAEYLSVSETQRLLQELKKNRVRATHIVVNQLVTNDALTLEDLTQLESMAEVGGLQLNQTLLRKTIHACRLTTSRKQIQEKYLKMLKEYPETGNLLDGICEVPLLAEEVTGSEAICKFANLLVTQKSSTSADDVGEKRSSWEHTPHIGDIVRIMGLQKAPHLNGLEGKIITDVDPSTGRYGVAVEYEGKSKKFSLQAKNISFVRASSDTMRSSKVQKTATTTEAKQNESDSKNRSEQNESSGGDEGLISDSTINKAKAVLEDPEIKQMIEENPRVKDAVEDVLSNPMNFMKYLSDPEISPFLSKAMSKF